eukprot:TRINITY_DN18702_c0_g1_i1.p1 TRINITY_DN18702_c0_g1~~TRINITY_DN18702_c0_g1_i1.p1  ORF type:complete len:1168 (+),score=288.03 TRINITY_DN18702_c0_g1_i1:73-3576(+)
MEYAAALSAIDECAGLLDPRGEWTNTVRERRELASVIFKKTWACVSICGTNAVFESQNAVLDVLCRLRSTRRPRESPATLQAALQRWGDALRQQVADGPCAPILPHSELLPELPPCETCTFHVSVLALISGAYHPAYLLLTSRRLILRPCLPEDFPAPPVEIPVLLFKALETSVVANDAAASANRTHQIIALVCKNTWTLSFSVRDRSLGEYVFRRLQGYLPEHYDRENFFAFDYFRHMQDVVPDVNVNAVLEDDLARIICNAKASAKWRVSHVNARYDVSDTMPPICIVPKDFRDLEVRRLAEFRILKRFPAVSWIHPTSGACLARASQPAVGVFRKRCDLDERYMDLIRTRNGVAVVDARPLTNAIANLAKGGGYINYPTIERVNADIGNIHAMSKSLAQLRKVLRASHYASFDLPSRLRKVTWVKHIQRILTVSLQVAQKLEGKTSVLVHCTNGWDRTSQIVSLANLMLDPFYRTKRGFLVLVEKDWIEAGHKFRERSLGKDGKTEHGHVHRKKGVSPIFPQFLESVVQLLHQFPTAFEFSEPFLRYIALTPWDGTTGTYMHNASKDRYVAGRTTLKFFDYMNWLLDAPLPKQTPVAGLAKMESGLALTVPMCRGVVSDVCEPDDGPDLSAHPIHALTAGDDSECRADGEGEGVEQAVPSVDLAALRGAGSDNVPIVDTARKPWLGGGVYAGVKVAESSVTPSSDASKRGKALEDLKQQLMDVDQMLCDADTSAKPSTDRDYLETARPSETDADGGAHGDARLPRPASMVSPGRLQAKPAGHRGSPKRRGTYPMSRSLCIEEDVDDDYVHIYLDDIKGALADTERSCGGLTSTICSSSPTGSMCHAGFFSHQRAPECGEPQPTASQSPRQPATGHRAEDAALAATFHNHEYQHTAAPVYPSARECDLVVWVEYHDPFHAVQTFVRSLQHDRDDGAVNETLLSNSSWVCIAGGGVPRPSRGFAPSMAGSFASHSKSCTSHPSHPSADAQSHPAGASESAASPPESLHHVESDMPFGSPGITPQPPSAPPSPFPRSNRSCSTTSCVSGSPQNPAPHSANPDCQTLENSQFNSRFIGDPDGAAARWVPDSEASSCLTCDRGFTFLTRRHHCRRCGQIFCGKCSEKRAHNGKTNVRVCDGCFAAIAVLSNRGSPPRSFARELAWSVRV